MKTVEFYRLFSWKVIGAGLAFVSQVLLARLLSIDDYGALIYVLSWLATLSMISKVGFDNAFLRFIPIYKESDDWAKLIGIIITALVTVTFMSMVTSYSAVRILTYIGPENEYINLFPWFFLLLPILVIQNVLGALLRGIKRQAVSELIESVFRQLLLIIAIVYAHWQFKPFLIQNALDQYLFTTIATVGLFSFVAWKKRPEKFKMTIPKFNLKDWFSSSTALWFCGGAYLIQNQADILMLGMLSKPSELASYGVASRLTVLIGMGLSTVTVIVAPRLAEIHARNQGKDRLQEELTKANKILAMYTFGTSGFMIVFGVYILRIFGEEFSVSYIPLCILTIGKIFEGASGCAGQLMAMTGHHWQASRILFATTFLNLVLNYMLIPKWGAVGAATATAISLVIWNSALVMYTNKIMGLNTSIFPTFFRNRNE